MRVFEVPTGFSLLPSARAGAMARVWRKLRLLATRHLLTWPSEGLSPRVSRGLRVLQGALLTALRRTPEAVLSAIGSVDVLPSILSHRAGARPPEPLLRELVPQLLVHLARGGGAHHLGELVLWDVPVRRLVDPGGSEADSAGGAVFTFDPPARGLLAQPSGLEVMTAAGASVPFASVSASSSPCLFPVAPALPARLSLVDTNPLALEEAHPDKAGNALSLGGRPVEEWLEALGAALELVRVGLPHYYAELALTLARIVPVGFEPERHLSASFREAPGLVYLTLHPSPLVLAEAIVHEVQHAKLNALSWLDPLLRNGHREWTSSPVRPDLRPLGGVLLAVHAFGPVAALHAGLAAAGHPEADTARFARRVAEVRRANADALATLERLAQPTPLGARLLREIAALVRATEGG